MKLLPPINLHNAQLLDRTEAGDLQCDPHLREASQKAGRAQNKARKHLVKKLRPFVWLEDEQLDVATFAETVAARLLDWAKSERERRIAVCPKGFEYLIKR